MAAERAALIPPITNASLETALQAKLKVRRDAAGSLGELESLAVRLGLIQNDTNPRFHSPKIILFAADHGLAVEDIGASGGHSSTAVTVHALLAERLPLSTLVRLQGLDLTVVDSGTTEALTQDPRLLARKMSYGTRNSCAGTAMSTEQAHAAMHVGMEIGNSLDGNMVACAGIGRGSAQSAALLLSCISGTSLRYFAGSSLRMTKQRLDHQLRVLQVARDRHQHLEDPVEILAAAGGFEVAMMIGLMLVAASRRRLVIADGMAACAALMVAAAIAPAVTDYCIHARSNPHPGLDRALRLFGQRPLVDVGIDSIDGTGATLAWPLVRCAAALLDDKVEPAPPRSAGRQ